jgi:hypothetical protein
MTTAKAKTDKIIAAAPLGDIREVIEYLHDDLEGQFGANFGQFEEFKSIHRALKSVEDWFDNVMQSVCEE